MFYASTNLGGESEVLTASDEVAAAQMVDNGQRLKAVKAHMMKADASVAGAMSAKADAWYQGSYMDVLRQLAEEFTAEAGWSVVVGSKEASAGWEAMCVDGHEGSPGWDIEEDDDGNEIWSDDSEHSHVTGGFSFETLTAAASAGRKGGSTRG